MAIEIYPNLFIGDATDVDGGYDYIIHAAKEPWHRKRLGYKGRSAPIGKPGYLYLCDAHEMFCNLVDPQDVKYIPDILINEILKEIDYHLSIGETVLVHCNKGESRAPSIGLMYIWECGFPPYTPEQFKKIYPAYNPSEGMKQYVSKFIEMKRGE